jgi:hypothetical protein
MVQSSYGLRGRQIGPDELETIRRNKLQLCWLQGLLPAWEAHGQCFWAMLLANRSTVFSGRNA